MQLYTGRTVKSTDFDYKYVGLEKAIDKEGPGFYFTTSIDTAFGYAGNDGIVIIADVDTKKFLTIKNKPKLSDIKKLILAAPDLEDTLTNFAENYHQALKIAIESYLDYDSALDSYQTIWHDFYRYEPVKYLEQLIKLGYNGHFGEKFEKAQFVDESQHIVVYNNKVIKVIDVKYSKGINESKKLINKILKEVGDSSSKNFNYTKQKINSGFIYNFQTDTGTKYEVYFTRNTHLKKTKTIWELAFGVLDEEGDINIYTITNKGEVYQVMSTITNITKDFIKNNKNNIAYIMFEPGEKRSKMYIQYIVRNLPNWNMEVYDNEYYISPN